MFVHDLFSQTYEVVVFSIYLSVNFPFFHNSNNCCMELSVSYSFPLISVWLSPFFTLTDRKHAGVMMT